MARATAGRVFKLALAATLVVPAGLHARASDTGAGCGTAAGKTFTGSASCHLTFRGFPITVFGDATVGSGDATVHVWTTVTELDGTPVVLVECTARAAGYTHCSSGLPDETTTVDNFVLAQATLRCHVQARGTGTYRCVSGSGQ